MLANLEADRARAAELAARILELENSIVELRAQQATVQERLDSYKYPVSTLAPEIISEIFIHFLPDYPTCPPFVGILSPTILTHICREWRAIALATPPLWRAVGLCKPHVFWEKQSQTAEIADTWMSRSGSCPLSIEVDERTAAVHLVNIPSAFVHRARWEYLTLRNLRKVSVELFKGPMPLVRHLDLAYEGGYSAEWLDMPQLRSAVLHDFGAGFVSLPWAQLTSLMLWRVSPNVCGGILKQTTCLIHCGLHFPLHCGTVEKFELRLPNLESLVCTLAEHAIYGAGSPKTLLAALIAPSLRRLDIEEEVLGPEPIKSLGSFIATSRCRPQGIRVKNRRRVPEEKYCTAFAEFGFMV